MGMKSLSLARPLAIIVIGLPGSGKSFFARQFAGMFSAPIVSHDLIRKNIFEMMEYSAKEDAVVAAIADNQIDELFKTGKTFLIDGGMSPRVNRLEVERKAKTLGYGTLTVWVQTDEPTSRMRSLKRNTKRPGDDRNLPMTDGAFTRYKRQFTPPSNTENTVVVSGKHTYTSQAKMVLQKLISPRDAMPATTIRPAASNTQDRKTDQSRDIQPGRHNITIG